MSLLNKLKAMRCCDTMLFGIALILVTNAIVLAGVYYNRSGEPEDTITLTERELGLPYRYGGTAENSGIELQLKHRDRNSGYYRYGNESPESVNGFDSEKLAALGFDVFEPINEHEDNGRYQRLEEKEVILVLEYNGKAYQGVLAAAQQHVDKLLAEQSSTENSANKNKDYKLKQAEQNLTREKTGTSRLFVVDAGLDRYVLRAKYPDRAKHFFMKGLVMARVKKNRSGESKYIGFVKSLSNNTLHVPLQHHAVLEAVMADDTHRNQNEAPRYEVTINVGRRLEAWVVGVRKLEGD